MIFKFEYSDQSHRENIISLNTDKRLIEEQNIIDGNFLIFTDEPRLEDRISRLEQDNLILMDALATTFEEVLALREQIGGITS